MKLDGYQEMILLHRRDYVQVIGLAREQGIISFIGLSESGVGSFNIRLSGASPNLRNSFNLELEPASSSANRTTTM